MSAVPERPPETWDELCADPRFRDLPYKMELLAGGQIVMTPHKPIHSHYQSKILRLLAEQLPNGVASVEYAVQVGQGVRVADVVWMSFAQANSDLTRIAAEHAPSICIEVASHGNTLTELLGKAEQYFEAGAEEVWLCLEGRLTFFTRSGEERHSVLAPDFPTHISLP